MNRIHATSFLAWTLIFVLAAVCVAQQQPPEPEPSEPTPVQPEPAAEPAPPPSLETARELLMEGEYEQAVEAYARVAEDPAKAIPAAIGVARCHLLTGRYAEGLEALGRVDGAGSAGWHLANAELLSVVGRYDDVLTHTQAAIDIDANHAGARLLHARTLELVGRRDDTIDAYRWFDQRIAGVGELPRDAEWITAAAQGFYRYSAMTKTNLAQRTQHVLNQMLQVAYGRIDRSYWPARLAAADLLREKFNNSEEDGSVSDYRAALRINPNLAAAHVGLGHVALEDWNFEAVEESAQQALAINPNYAPAMHLLADSLILQRKYDAAREQAEKALAINPNDLVALGLKAAAAAAQYDEEEAQSIIAAASKINPRCAVVHRKVGLALNGARQYAACERELLTAIEYDPTDANARTELGMMYMQWGREDKAREALEAAWLLDPFNERTKFTLDLLDSLEKFARHETDHFIIKFDGEKDPGIGEFLGRYLEDIYGQVTADYGAEPDVKTIIEVFPTHRAFGVRVTGRPWIGTVGASTGPVIAIDSPRDSMETEGPYNVARVLKHEFTHTVTLAATNNRIPHWLTEGLAVYQEDAPRSFRWCELLSEAIRHDRLFTLESINWGFIRPQRPYDRIMAYAQSEWMCEYIVERFGYDAIDALLRRFRDGQTQTQVFQEQFGLSETQFDTDFVAWAKSQATSWGFNVTPAESPLPLRDKAEAADDAALWGRLARAEWDAENFDHAMSATRKALAKDPNNLAGLEVLGKLLALAAVHEPTGGNIRAFEQEGVPALKHLAELDPGGWTAPKLLSEYYLQQRRDDEALPWLQRLQRVCPMDPTSWRGLGGIYLDRGEDDKALTQLLELARTEEHDAQVPHRIGLIYRRQNRLGDATYWLRQALYIDPFNAELHEDMAETCMLAGKATDALPSYRMLTVLEPDKAEHFAAAALAAKKAGEEELAVEMAKRAVELDAESPAKVILNQATP